MNKKNNNLTPSKVGTLSRCEVFVFGSNLQGQHMGGAARIAFDKFGAEWGVGDGPTWQCYSIPTMHGGLEEIRPYAKKFIAYAKAHPRNRFLLTRVGCGIAGFKDAEMANLFYEADEIPNITIPKEWITWMATYAAISQQAPIEPKEAPKVINEQILKEVCNNHLYQIGAGTSRALPSIRVRYVEEDNKFGYTGFGDYFFYGDDFYVWSCDDKWADRHDQNIVFDVFHDECEGRGYAHKVLLAGVNTKVLDSNSEWIYTGDVIDIKSSDNPAKRYQFALGTFDNENETDYRFILDNHCLLLSECEKQQMKLRRIGTVFFKLIVDEYPTQTICTRTMMFNGWNDTKEYHKLKLIMAKLTPNFEQEEWKYSGLNSLGVEFD